MATPHDAYMMSQQIGFSILTAPLAAIDRRSLSQAWYSALHLASRGVRQEEAGSSVIPPRRPAVCAKTFDPSTPRSARVADVRIVPQHARVDTRCLPSEERRATRSRLARRIERAFFGPDLRRAQRATFTVDGMGGRVHVALQSSATGMRLVAVCQAAARDRVARALEEARYALAARGVALRVDVSEV